MDDDIPAGRLEARAMARRRLVSAPLLRAATRDDCRAIAGLYRVSSDGVADYIWRRRAAPGEDPLDVGQRRYEQEDSVFSYHNCTVVDVAGEVVGMLVAFPMYVDTDDPETDPVLAPYSQLEEDRSYYICGMALQPDYRGQGIGSRLLRLAEQRAGEAGLDKLSLIVFEQNAGALRLYQRAGYKEVARAAVVAHPLIHFTGDALLMVKVLDNG